MSLSKDGCDALDAVGKLWKRASDLETENLKLTRIASQGIDIETSLRRQLLSAQAEARHYREQYRKMVAAEVLPWARAMSDFYRVDVDRDIREMTYRIEIRPRTYQLNIAYHHTRAIPKDCLKDYCAAVGRDVGAALAKETEIVFTKALGAS